MLESSDLLCTFKVTLYCCSPPSFQIKPSWLKSSLRYQYPIYETQCFGGPAWEKQNHKLHFNQKRVQYKIITADSSITGKNDNYCVSSNNQQIVWKQCLRILVFHDTCNNPHLKVKSSKCRGSTLSSFPSSGHKNSFYYLCFSKIKPGAPAVSKPPKCQEVLQDNMKNKNNEKHHFLSIHLVQLEGIRHCLSPPLSPLYRPSKYQKVKSIHPSLR